MLIQIELIVVFWEEFHLPSCFFVVLNDKVVLTIDHESHSHGDPDLEVENIISVFQICSRPNFRDVMTVAESGVNEESDLGNVVNVFQVIDLQADLQDVVPYILVPFQFWSEFLCWRNEELSNQSFVMLLLVICTTKKIDIAPETLAFLKKTRPIQSKSVRMTI